MNYQPSEMVDPLAAAELEALHQIRDQLKNNPVALGVTGSSTAPMLDEDFPFPGVKRFLIPRKPTGGVFALEAGKYITLVAANHSRVGGSIVNKGEKPALLKLVTPEQAEASGNQSIGTIWLAGGGGAWDFRLGPVLWLGHVSGAGEGGASSCTVVEV